jgi:hypothetical protein
MPSNALIRKTKKLAMSEVNHFFAEKYAGSEYLH